MGSGRQLGLFDVLYVDSFAGGGGASTGIELATGHPVDIAINHDQSAIKEVISAMREERMNKNAEGYADPTAGAAYNNIRREEKLRDAEAMEVIGRLIPVMKQTAELAGFEVVGRITLRDKSTGKEWK